MKKIGLTLFLIFVTQMSFAQDIVLKAYIYASGPRSCDYFVESDLDTKTISITSEFGPGCDGGVKYDYVRISENHYFNSEVNSILRVESEDTFSEFKSIMDFHKRTFKIREFSH